MARDLTALVPVADLRRIAVNAIGELGESERVVVGLDWRAAGFVWGLGECSGFGK